MDNHINDVRDMDQPLEDIAFTWSTAGEKTLRSETAVQSKPRRESEYIKGSEPFNKNKGGDEFNAPNLESDPASDEARPPAAPASSDTTVSIDRITTSSKERVAPTDVVLDDSPEGAVITDFRWPGPKYPTKDCTRSAAPTPSAHKVAFETELVVLAAEHEATEYEWQVDEDEPNYLEVLEAKSRLFLASPSFALEAVHLEAAPNFVDNSEVMAGRSWAKIVSAGLYISTLQKEILYASAKCRCQNLPGIIELAKAMNPSQPWILARIMLCEALFWLGDFALCLSGLKELLIEIPFKDPILENICVHVTSIIEWETYKDQCYHAQSHRSRPFTLSAYQFPVLQDTSHGRMSPVQELIAKWNVVREREKGAVDQFMRLACLATNDLEGVFRIDGDSWSRLIRRGFHEHAIEHIAAISKKRQKAHIIDILKSTLAAMESVSLIFDDFSVFNSEFIMRLHKTMMAPEEYDESVEDGDAGNDGTYTVVRKLRIGQFRQVACITRHFDDRGCVKVTQFCHHSIIPQEMEQYCTVAQTLLANDSVDPFAKSAWLQWALLRVHPFEDGNGRISRIVSSIPLCKSGLPPVVVASQFKKKYFQVLQQADRHEGLDGLQGFLVSSLAHAVDHIATLPPDAALGPKRPPCIKRGIYPGFRFAATTPEMPTSKASVNVVSAEATTAHVSQEPSSKKQPNKN
jgi:hypothetical protein